MRARATLARARLAVEDARATAEGRISAGYQYVYAPRDDDPRERSRVWFRDRLGVALPRDHRLASRKTVRIADLGNEHILWPSRAVSPTLSDALRAALVKRGEALVVHEENDPEVLLTLVASGGGITFFSESAAALVRTAATFKRVRDLDVVILGRLVWRAADEGDPVVRTLLDLTRTVRDR